MQWMSEWIGMPMHRMFSPTLLIDRTCTERLQKVYFLFGLTMALCSKENEANAPNLTSCRGSGSSFLARWLALRVVPD